MFYLIVRRPVKKFLQNRGYEFNLAEIEEKFAPYFSNLETVDKHWSIREEQYYRRQFMYSTMPNATLELYKSGKVEKGEEFRTVQGIHTYNILRNPKYCELFQYLTPAIGSNKVRNQFIKDEDTDTSNNVIQSDLVKLAFDLPYMTSEQREKFQFNEEGYKDLLGEDNFDKMKSAVEFEILGKIEEELGECEQPEIEIKGLTQISDGEFSQS